MFQPYSPGDSLILLSLLFIIFHFKEQCFFHRSLSTPSPRWFFSVSFRTWYLDKHCVSPSLWWVQWWLRVTRSEQSAPLPAVSGHSENSLTTHTSLWFERSDKSAITSGKFGEAQLCFDISRWFQMPKHRGSKPTKIGELQHNCCQGKSKASSVFPYSYHNTYSWGCQRGNGTRIPFLVCTQWMGHQELCLLLSGGDESIMSTRDGRCRNNVKVSIKQLLRGQVSRLGLLPVLMNRLLHRHCALLSPGIYG